MKIVVPTGDSQRTADAVARQIRIDQMFADVGPAAKGKLVADAKAEGLSVAMAGDGVNDAPALAAANVGIAMGTGGRRCQKRGCDVGQR